MSLILEALRKSEAERQIGRAPGLLTPMPILRPPQRRRRWVGGVLVLGVALAAAMGGAWWLGRNGAPAPVVADAAVTQAPAPAQAVPQPAAVAPPQAAPVDPPSAPVARDPMPAAGPADLPSDPAFRSTERESLPLPPPVSAPPVTTAAAGSVQPAPAPARMAPAATDGGAVASAPAAEEWLPPLRSLTEAERGGLPPLRMSMHVFNDDPARRFVLIDGRRWTEGEQLADGVRIERIRRDGAELDLRGRRILLERP